MDSPEVVFLLPAPIHEHIYSNGHICLNILVSKKYIIIYIIRESKFDRLDFQFPG